jgi:DHA2 family multidrug resistance protein-like MFS transporter
MSVLDGTIANTALPTIARDLGASPAESIWVINAFQLAITASLLPFAALGELRGPTRVYRAGVIVFVAGSLACALARSLPVLIAARAFQGLGASAIMALSPAILRDIFPRAQLGRALGLNAFVVATSSAAGPTLGGLILAFAPWPWLFAINVPLGLINIAMNRALPRRERNRGGLDIPSVITSALGFALTIWGLDGFARGEPAWTIALRLIVGVASAVWFVRRQFTLEKPMIALDPSASPRSRSPPRRRSRRSARRGSRTSRCRSTSRSRSAARRSNRACC